MANLVNLYILIWVADCAVCDRRATHVCVWSQNEYAPSCFLCRRCDYIHIIYVYDVCARFRMCMCVILVFVVVVWCGIWNWRPPWSSSMTLHIKIIYKWECTIAYAFIHTHILRGLLNEHTYVTIYDPDSVQLDTITISDSMQLVQNRFSS